MREKIVVSEEGKISVSIPGADLLLRAQEEKKPQVFNFDVDFEMMNDYVAVQRFDETPDSELAIKTRDRSDRAMIIAVGEGRIVGNAIIPMDDIRPGMETLISKHGGMDVSIDGVEYVIVRHAEMYIKRREKL